MFTVTMWDRNYQKKVDEWHNVSEVRITSSHLEFEDQWGNAVRVPIIYQYYEIKDNEHQN